MKKNFGIHKILFIVIILFIFFICFSFFKLSSKKDIVEHYTPPATSFKPEAIASTPEKEKTETETNEDKKSLNQEQIEVPNSVTIKEFWIVTNLEGRRVVYGKAVNNTQRRLPKVEIHFNLLDKNGTKVGSTSAIVTSLPAGSTWKFEAEFNIYEVVSAQIDSIDTGL